MEPHNRHVQEQIHSTSNRQLAYGREHWSSPKDTTCSKSWAQQTEESYQLQLALALRLSSDSSSAADPYFLDSATGDRPIGSARDLSHRFWVRALFDWGLRGFVSVLRWLIVCLLCFWALNFEMGEFLRMHIWYCLIWFPNEWGVINVFEFFC